MSYIEIQIGGKLRGLKFNQLAMQEFSLNYVREAKLVEQAPELFFTYNIFHSGLLGHCIVKKEEPEFTFSDVIDWVDEMYENRQDEDSKKVIEVFSNTRLWQDTVKRISDKAEEKKS